jgi:hypothetical protein
MWVFSCRSCNRPPLALQVKEARKEGGPQKENKEIRDLGCSPSKRPPLAIKREEALEEGDPLQGDEDNREEGSRTCEPGFGLEGEAHSQHAPGTKNFSLQDDTPPHPVKHDYMVAALVDDFHSLFEGRKSQRREDRSKRR